MRAYVDVKIPTFEELLKLFDVVELFGGNSSESEDKALYVGSTFTSGWPNETLPTESGERTFNPFLVPADLRTLSWENMSDAERQQAVKEAGDLGLWDGSDDLDPEWSFDKARTHILVERLRHRFKREGLRAATFQELVVFGTRFPHVQMEKTVIGLNAWMEHPKTEASYIQLSRRDGKRVIEEVLFEGEEDYGNDAIFLAVKTSS